MFSLKTILHPTDFSDQSCCAFRVASSLAKDHGAKIIVLHVYPPPINYGEMIAREQPETYEETLWSNLEGVHPLDGAVPVEHRLIEGEASKEIIRLAKDEECDMIVMGTHGRTGLGRFLMGSTAEAIVRRAACPVLTVKTPLREEVAATADETCAAAKG
jgi:nucleotide-binding universal stress UspA family protein